MKIELTKEIIFQTARSGGKGGQNVNKVETMVEGYFSIRGSALLTDDEKEVLEKKLASRINSDGYLQVRSQVHRTQLGNKAEVIRKMHALIEAGLKKEKRRIATKPSKAAKERRIGQKKRQSEIKSGRRRVRGEE
ncbi:MAG TPA: alternative ribosome rescue aminoacyl-tRNA hydrolase ArfB [Puia sp.]|jgi:ribosome-associated protein|nr:alternative ribosome rescue aminoacyl-tRNA hydrolase ArfB [Puia sp.]